MKNETSIQYFFILPFSGNTKYKPLITTFFFLIYLVGVLINSSIITVICLAVQLHEPMYLFICNLSIVDIFYTTITVPKLLHILLSGNHLVYFAQCYSQLYFLFTSATAEEILLFIMAYDRYVAICLPLHYHRILSRRNCILITMGMWTAAFLNSLIFIESVLYMSSCHSNLIYQLFCDPKSLTKTSCIGSQMLFVVTSIEMTIFTFIPLMCTCISYVNIFSVIFKMNIKESQKKAFSTCVSHLIVMTTYNVTAIIGYLIPPYLVVLDLVFHTVYTTIIPVINPIIYSLQNSNVRSAFLELTGMAPKNV